MRKWLNIVLFVLVVLGVAIVMLERKAVAGNENTQEIVIEIDNVLDR